ncbi:MAG TPA: ATP-binding protein, partial [Vicinamibacterales bacterium]
MKRWFARLPIHRKPVVMALLVTTVALLIAGAGLVLVDYWRFRSAAHQEAESTARVLAENTDAAVAFGDAEAARATLDSVRVRPSVRRACLYLPDDTLFAGVAREPQYACPATQPVGAATPAAVVGMAPVVSNERIIGTVFVEHDAGDVWMRVGVALLAGLDLLVVAGLAALLLANRLHRAISGPIAQLAASARAIQPGRAQDVPTPEPPAEDEIGELVRAFGEMLRRVRDATAEREALLAREREANRLKDEFLAAVSHELRTPLNAITGWAHLLTTAAPDPEMLRKGLAAIARNAKAQTRVIEDLVDVSRIVTGKLAIRFDPVDLCEVVEHAVEAARAPAAAKGLRLQVDTPRGVCLVNGDRERLQQVLGNLLSNAMKFTPPEGAIAVSLTPAGGMYSLVVADTGIGIPPAFLPHVFDRFRQADGSMTREHGGLGLGLAIVKELVELHGGSVRAESAGPGR